MQDGSSQWDSSLTLLEEIVSFLVLVNFVLMAFREAMEPFPSDFLETGDFVGEGGRWISSEAESRSKIPSSGSTPTPPSGVHPFQLPILSSQAARMPHCLLSAEGRKGEWGEEGNKGGKDRGRERGRQGALL